MELSTEHELRLPVEGRPASRSLDSAQSWRGMSLKAGEDHDDELVRCGELVPVAMRRDCCGLETAIDAVIDTLRSCAQSSDIFILREGYARPWQPRPLLSARQKWKKGDPIPDGHKLIDQIVPPGRGCHDHEWTKKAIKWVGDGEEPQPIESLADYWERVRVAWRKSAAATGHVDGATKTVEPQWFALVAMRRRVAIDAALLPKPAPVVQLVPSPPMEDAPAKMQPADAPDTQPVSTGVGDGTAVVPPIGGQWPHKKNAPWSDEERDAMFVMRHQFRLKDEQIGAVVGQKHQRISQLIGAAQQWKHDDWPTEIKWRPSADLLARCKLSKPLQPLQTVAQSLSSDRSQRPEG